MRGEYDRVKKISSVKGYELIRLLGEGGTARVYCIVERDSGIQYACKVSEHSEWLRIEAELLWQISHPLFPKWKDYWICDGFSFLIMEYIEGTSLEAHLKRRKFSWEETIRISLELADGLFYLHEQEPCIIYRDLKPSNVILQNDGRVRLLDLGAAAAPMTWRVGTPGYASPEQQLTEVCANFSDSSDTYRSLKPSSDVYSLGMMMHYMLSGRDPLVSKDEIRPVRKKVPGIPAGLDDVIWRCIEPHPGERISQMRDLIRELSQYYHQSKFHILSQEIKAFFRKHPRKKVVSVKNIWLSEYKL